MTAERTIATTTHGRYLVDLAEGAAPVPLLVGLHGYAEQAAVQMSRLQAVRGGSRLHLVAVQGLHRFYRSGGQELAAGWMTREDRELMVADNVAYVNSVVDALAREFQEPAEVVFAGFSQGASMAWRAAALGRRSPAGVVALGGDIPPELSDAQLSRIPRALIGWGVRDRFYTMTRRTADEDRLRQAGVQTDVVELDAGHAWTDAFTQAASAWLSRRR